MRIFVTAAVLAATCSLASAQDYLKSRIAEDIGKSLSRPMYCDSLLANHCFELLARNLGPRTGPEHSDLCAKYDDETERRTCDELQRTWLKYMQERGRR